MDDYCKPNDYIRSEKEFSTSFLMKWVHEDLKDGYIATHESELIKGPTDLEALKKRFGREFFEIPRRDHEFADIKLFRFDENPNFANHYYMETKYRKDYYRYLYLKSEKIRVN